MSLTFPSGLGVPSGCPGWGWGGGGEGWSPNTSSGLQDWELWLSYSGSWRCESGPQAPSGSAWGGGWEERSETRMPGNVNIKGVSGKGACERETQMLQGHGAT